MRVRKTLDEGRLLKSEEVARILGVTKRTLANWTRDSLIPSIRIGRRSRRYIRSELEAWIQAAKKINDRGTSDSK